MSSKSAAVPAALAGPERETGEPEDGDDYREDPQPVHREAEPAEQQRHKRA